jgi:hypothetical protein
MVVTNCLFLGNSVDISMSDPSVKFQLSNCVFSGPFPSGARCVTNACASQSVTASWFILHVDTYYCVAITPAATVSNNFVATDGFDVSAAPFTKTGRPGLSGTDPLVPSKAVRVTAAQDGAQPLTRPCPVRGPAAVKCPL